jgi:hypothetical protein
MTLSQAAIVKIFKMVGKRLVLKKKVELHCTHKEAPIALED